MKKLIAVGITALLLSGLSGQAEEAKVLYDKNCSSCHGKDGKGTPIAPALNTPEFAAKFAYDSALVDVIRKGAGIMPGFDKLSDADVADIVAYLRSLP